MLIGRRAFLQSLGLVGAASVMGCNNAPREKLYSYLSPSTEITPGIPSYYASVCRACPAGCGILVKIRENRPIKLEGNPAHQLNQGRLCALGQAWIQSLYSPRRISHGYVGKGSKRQTISLKKAISILGEKTGATTNKKKRVAFISGLENGTLSNLLRSYISQFVDSQVVFYEPLHLGALKAASKLIFGSPEVPFINLTGVDYLCSLGADILDTWLSPVQFSHQWSTGHGFSGTRAMTMEYLGSRRNLTATAADRFHIITPDRYVPLLVSVLKKTFRKGRASLSPDLAGTVSQFLRLLRPTEGGSAIDKLAEELSNALLQASSPLVLVGGHEVTGDHAFASHCLSLLINAVLGSSPQSLVYGADYHYSHLNTHSDVLGTLNDAAQGKYDVLCLSHTNPAYTLPNPEHTKKQLEAAPFVVSFAAEEDETTDLADLVIPIAHSLESWGDYIITKDMAGLMQPVRKSPPSVPILGELLASLTPGKAGSDFRSLIATRWEQQMKVSSPSSLSAQATDSQGLTSFDRLLVNGGSFDFSKGSTLPPIQKQWSEKLSEVINGQSKAQDMIVLAPFTVGLFDGRGASLDWLREVPDSLTQTAWDVPLEVNQVLAKSHHLSNGDRVILNSEKRAIEAVVVLDNDLPERVIALRCGGGRNSFSAAPASDNVQTLFSAKTHPLTGDVLLRTETITLVKKSADRLTSVSGSPFSEDRHLVLALSLDDAKAGRYPIMTRHGEVFPDSHGKVHGEPLPMPHQEKGGERPRENIIPLQHHPHHRWGMVIDLDKCIGCGACVVACYAENNIPVVGFEEVRRGRELSWIRIEKHLFLRKGRYVPRFLPVMCQHCDQAPCETVCPVFAAYHTPDGLNAQVYNRCIGTRYCSNNCPYKVRRFNYFQYHRPKSERAQLNPDVTVRGRGVMEKCTMCVQRIREVTNRAKVEGRAVKDGEILPACAQTCPTNAIVFGDFKQQSWEMSTKARDPRGYRLLDYQTNTRPGVVYLRKVYSDAYKV